MSLSNLLNIALIILIGLCWYINESLMQDVKYLEEKLFFIRKICSNYKDSSCAYCKALAKELIDEVDNVN